MQNPYFQPLAGIADEMLDAALKVQFDALPNQAPVTSAAAQSRARQAKKRLADAMCAMERLSRAKSLSGLLLDISCHLETSFTATAETLQRLRDNSRAAQAVTNLSKSTAALVPLAPGANVDGAKQESAKAAKRQRRGGAASQTT